MGLPFRSAPSSPSAPILPTSRFDVSPNASAPSSGSNSRAQSIRSQGSSTAYSPAASASGALSPASTITFVSMTQAAPQGALSIKEKLTPRATIGQLGEELLTAATLGSGRAHQVLRLAPVGWRTLITASDAFIAGSSKHGLAHMAGFATATLAGPWVATEGSRILSRPSEGAQASSRRTRNMLLGMLALGSFLDPAGQAGVLLGGAGGLALKNALPQGGRTARLAANALPWLAMEAGRVGVPMATHALTRRALIRSLEANAARYEDVEDASRAWSELAFVGSHLSQDTGLTPFASSSPVPTVLSWLGLFASHQSLSIAQQFEHGYNAFSFEYFPRADGVLMSSHNTYWTYGTLENAFREVAQGLASYPDRLVAIKVSAQYGGNRGNLDFISELNRSGLYDHLTVRNNTLHKLELNPHRSMTRGDLLRLNKRAILMSDGDVWQTRYDAESINDLQKHGLDIDVSPLNIGGWALNLFTSWGFQPWSERTNLAIPHLLARFSSDAASVGGNINVVYANDVETTGLIAFKRAYNAPPK